MASRSALTVLVLAAVAGLLAMNDSPSVLAPVASPTPVAAKPRPKPERRKGLHRIAIVHGTVALRARPEGRVLARAEARTEFGGRRVLSVAARRGAWLGVVAPEVPNGRLAWVDGESRALQFRSTAYSLHADLSGRRLELRKGGRVLRRHGVAIGRPGSETPTGRFAVTDKLRGSRYGPYYGCCILALSGHQPKLPAGWAGGSRLAIHGTDAPGTIGAAASAGCLRAAEADLRVLMRRVPLGTPVFIRD
jgi:L,D-transpeptidase catalytic domain